MNKRIVGTVAVLGSILLGPGAVAAQHEAGSAPGYDVESVVGADVLDHGQGEKGHDDHGKDDDGKDDHDHDGDGRPDHDPEDHDADDDEDDDKTKSDDD